MLRDEFVVPCVLVDMSSSLGFFASQRLSQLPTIELASNDRANLPNCKLWSFGCQSRLDLVSCLFTWSFIDSFVQSSWLQTIEQAVPVERYRASAVDSVSCLFSWSLGIQTVTDAVFCFRRCILHPGDDGRTSSSSHGWPLLT